MRQYRHGKPLGEGRDVILGVDGSMVGIGPEPGDHDIDTGCTTADFNLRDRVLVWWYGLWWSATVQYVSHTRASLSIRWSMNNQLQTGYKVRLVMPW